MHGNSRIKLLLNGQNFPIFVRESSRGGWLGESERTQMVEDE